ncbi:MAG: hypothetical protein JWM73_664 [Solirubrobacterales bacterium]|nr:hypothetical protein [Solirubrobacterales bacterium]
MSHSRSRRPLVALALAVAASLAFATSADAACSAPLSKPFAPWLDSSSYALVPGGDFEAGGPAWTLDGASAAAGSETFHVGGAGDRSVSIPRGASITSPAFCGGLDHPTLRLFAKGGGLLGLLNVTVIYTDAGGLLRSQPLGLVTGSGGWQPSLPLLTLSGLPLLTGSEMAVRLTAISGSFTVDDVYVDPYGKRF